jgi:hypothetical protein
VKVALTLVVRDEADILDAHLAFHLDAGVDVVLAVDHGSTDGTSEILGRYAREGHVRLFREEGRQNEQGAWVTRLARLAATEERADWVLLSDGDEFWWPRIGSLKDVLGVIPRRYGVISAPSRSFLLRPDDGRSFLERMTVRFAMHAAINDPAGPFRPVSKLAIRAHPDVRVRNGNHSVAGVPYVALETWHPIEVFHYPLRSPAQSAAKYEKTLAAWADNPRGDLARAQRLSDASRLESLHERLVVDDESLSDGLRDGSLVSDTRLRDALRTLAGVEELPADGTTFPLPSDGSPRLVAAGPDVAEDVRYAVEIAVLSEANAVRTRRRVDDLGRRVAALECALRRPVRSSSGSAETTRR